MTIDVAELRRFAEEAGWPSVSPSEFVELLDAYEERDRLRAALRGLVDALDAEDVAVASLEGPTWGQSVQRTRVARRKARRALEGRE